MFPLHRQGGRLPSLLLTLTLILLFARLPLHVCGAEVARRPFAIPAAAAEVTLETFSDQAGAQLVYLIEDVRGVATNSVQGPFAPRDALERLVAHTALRMELDGKTGAFVIRREPNSRAGAEPPKPTTQALPPSMKKTTRALLAAALASLVGATGSAQTNVPPTKEETVQLSPFEVVSGNDRGYVATNTLAGTRFNTALRDTPSALSIFTPEFMEDIGVTNVLQAYEYGLNTATDNADFTANTAQGNDIVLKIRGLRRASLGRNYFAWSNNSDIYNTDRLTFARGPNAVIFGIGGPGGIINTDTKRALFTRRHEAKVRVGSWDDYRATVDVNEQVSKTLAVRVNALWQDRKGWRDYEFDDRRGLALAATWRPFARTQVRLDAERMRVDQNKPFAWSVFDVVTPWINAGRPMAQTFNQAVPGTQAVNVSSNTFYIMNTGELLRLNGSRMGAFPAVSAISLNVRNLNDFSIAPRTVWVGGPANDSYSNFDATGLFIEQEFFKDFFVEAAANIQHTRSLWSRPLNWTDFALKVDANRVRPDGSVNPFAGQYYVESDRAETQTPNRWNTDYRLTASYRFDLGKWLGKHQVAGLVSRREDEDYNKDFQTMNVGNPALPNSSINARNRIAYRTYVAFSGPNTLRLPDHTLNPFTTGVNTAGVRSALLQSSARSNLTRVDTALVATQSSWWDGRFVATVGLRRDIQEAYGSSTVLGPTGIVVAAQRRSTPTSSQGNTRTFGTVLRVTENFGLYYNNADNFTPQSATIWEQDFLQRNNQIGNRLGKGEDIGVKFELWQGRINGSFGHYEVSETNSIKSPVGDFRVAAQNIYSALGIPYIDIGGNDVTDFVARGTELDVTANLTSNWRLQLNAQKSRSAESNIWPWQTKFLEDNLARFTTNASVPVAGNANGNTVGAVTKFMQDFLAARKAVDTQGQLNHIGWAVNMFTHYTVTEGRLRGLSAGVGVNWRGPQIAGLDAANHLVRRGQYHIINANLGYSHKLFGLQKPVKFQLNIDNLFDNDIRVPLVSDGAENYRWTYITPRRVALSTTVQF